ncbi:MAG: double-strand break repair helicase AddA, partial [Alphaproteobacteria bacterium]|nr:double-strand break repair helicase AddA [Alphaproteobacteria bacterium]
DLFDLQSLRRCMEINGSWSARTGQQAAEAIGDWLAGDAAARVAALDALASVFLTQKGEPRASTSQDKIDPSYPDHCARVVDCIAAIRERKALLQLADRLVPALRLGRAFALAWDEAKKREGLIDFDDQIREAASLLNRKELSDWIRYKLDRRFDHILVDEAQDTNAAQWDIIFALTGEFFAGEGQRGEIMRTLFVVGDYKQAIFRFQGTSPENFASARDRVRDLMAGAAENAAMLRSNRRLRELQEYGLGRSFRTSQPVLDFVDKAIAAIGHKAFGLDRPAEPHSGWTDWRGHVALWRPVGAAADEDDEEPKEAEGDQPWLSKPDRQMADRIAQQIAQWLDPRGGGFLLKKNGDHRAKAGDIMVLVRKRRELAALIVARLHARGVPVAGVDRLRLGDPLALRDLLAALRFAAQPLDDLNLANLLVSPLIGWTQEELLRFAWRDRRLHLWEHLRQGADADAAPAMEMLLDLLSRADFGRPQDLLAWLLTGTWQGRRKLVARLGPEANDPIDELVNAAHAYCATATPSLVGFLQWFDAGEGELKREADNAEGLVRVITVHGSKGLQAPIVILADATGNPASAPRRTITVPDRHDERRRIPLPGLREGTG